MRLIHFADTHLGFRAYTRETRGLNQREADVAETFDRVVSMLIDRRPDVVIIGGDIFHVVRPTNTALVHAMEAFTRLRRGTPDTLVVMVAGNHDTPRSAGASSILPLFRELGIHVADRQAQRFTFADRQLSVLAVPDAGYERPVFEPDMSARYNVCVAHLETGNVLKTSDRSAHEVPLEQLSVDRFQYVGCGHYHTYTPLAANAFYSGSIDYTSSDIWSERRAERANPNLGGKVLVERDLDTGAQQLLHIPPVRVVEDLPPIDATGMSPRDLDDAIQNAVSQVAIDGAIVRQVVREAPMAVTRELDQQALRSLRSRALHFHLDCRKSELARPARASLRAPGKSLEELLIETIKRNREKAPLDIPVEHTIERGLESLRQAAEMESEKPREPVVESSVADVAA